MRERRLVGDAAELAFGVGHERPADIGLRRHHQWPVLDKGLADRPRRYQHEMGGRSGLQNDLRVEPGFDGRRLARIERTLSLSLLTVILPETT